MKRCVLAAAAALWLSPASATMVITRDLGGSISQYEQRYAMVRATGETVVIDGPCFSACTLVLGLVPPHRVCVTPRARLGFHAAWFPDPSGGRVFSAAHTRRLHDSYPAPVRYWIARHGGLSNRFLVMQGRELLAFLPACREAFGPRPVWPFQIEALAAGQHLELSVSSNGLRRGL